MSMRMPLSVINLLSESARDVMRASPADAFARLVGFEPVALVESSLRAIKPTQVLSGIARDLDLASTALAGMWLWFDFEPQTHALVQGHSEGTGALWHAILHRREGDFANAKYWVRQVGRHPAYPSIGARVAEMLRDMPADKSLLRLAAAAWDPGAMVDFVAEVERSNDPIRRRLAVEIQRCEWQTLFEWTVMHAAGVDTIGPAGR
jgi:hypothetical protein